MSILIKNATVLTQNARREINNGCDVLITGNGIAAVGKNIHEKADDVIDGTNKIVLPGFVNAHTHVAMTLFRGLGENLPLHEWLKKKIWPLEMDLTPEHVYYSSQAGIAEMIRSGVTTFIDMYHKYPDKIAGAAEQTGMRAGVGFAVMDRSVKDARAFIKKWKNTSLVSPHIAAHSIYAHDGETLQEAKSLAHTESVLFHMHLSETRKEVFECLKKTKKYPVEYIDSLGLIDEKSLFAHASWVTKREIGILGRKHATIVNCPVSNLKLATGGICPVREYYEQGANVCIGTDGPASNNSHTMFESVKLSALLQKHHYWKADVLPAQAFLDFATINGARALGIEAGSIERGKLADIILLDATLPNMHPQHDLVSNIVYGANPSNVSDVIINGASVLRERKIVSFNERIALEKLNGCAYEAL